MKNSILGKGMFLWLIERCGGDPKAIAWLAKLAGFGHVAFKIADGTYKKDGVEQLSYYLCREGIQAVGWQYIYGYNAVAEANIAIELCREYNLDAFVVNAEKQFNKDGMAATAKNYMQRLRGGLGDDFTIALSSYRYPTMHHNFPWKQFLEFCDISMPQVYWMGETSDVAPIKNLNSSYSQYIELYEKIGFTRPILFTGAAFSEHGWCASAVQVQNFLSYISEMSKKDFVLDACNFWEWWEAKTEHPELWDVIEKYEWRYKPMSEFDKWADAVTDALREEGHQIPDPPDTTTKPDPVQIIFNYTVNVRDTPAGNDVGDISGIVTVQPPFEMAKLNGTPYNWGMIVDHEEHSGHWVATDIGTII